MSHISDPHAPTRVELARFLPDQRSIKAFEKLFDLVPSEFNSIYDLIESVSLAASSAGAAAQMAVDALMRMANALELASTVPRFEYPKIDDMIIPPLALPVADVLEPIRQEHVEIDQFYPAPSPQQLIDSDFTVNGDLILPKTSGKGIRVDKVAPTFGWRDLLGSIDPRATGGGRPNLAAYRGGNVREFAFSAADDLDLNFHLPHDYLPGSDIFIHFHWSHNGTAITGNIIADFHSTYTKGHNQAIFPAEKTVSITYATVNIATTPRYSHRIEEVQFSSSGGSATLWDSNDLEPDGVVLMHFEMTAIPTITGGSPNEPFVHYIDIHYQSTGTATKQKAPDFYT